MKTYKATISFSMEFTEDGKRSGILNTQYDVIDVMANLFKEGDSGLIKYIQLCNERIATFKSLGRDANEVFKLIGNISKNIKNRRSNSS